jgi:RNA polymerase sigma-70 factor (ECF subfamily)
MDEMGLIQAAQQGDLDAFNRLVLTYQDMAYNLAYRLLSDEEAAEDATQVALISAYKNLSSYRGGIFRAWLMRIVSNTCYDELRRRKRHPTTSLEPLDDDEEDTIESPYWLKDDTPSPEQSLELLEVENAVQHCLNSLPEEFKTVVILVDVQGMDYQEVAEIVGKPLGTIKSRLARARFRMRDCLKGFQELLPSHFRLKEEEMK